MEVNKLFSQIDLGVVGRVASILLGAEASTIGDLQKIAERRTGWVQLKTASENDADVLDQLISPQQRNDEVYVVSDLSYQNGYSGFQIPAGELTAFVTSYFNAFRQMLFDGDVLIVCPAQKSAWFYHHEGMVLYWPANSQ